MKQIENFSEEKIKRFFDEFQGYVNLMSKWLIFPNVILFDNIENIFIRYAQQKRNAKAHQQRAK